MNTDKQCEWPNGHNTVTKTCNHSSSNVDSSSSSSATNKFGSHAPGIRRAMEILESQFGHNKNNMTKRNAFAVSDHSGLFGGSSSQSQEPINVVATNGDEFGDGNESNRKKKKKKTKNNDDGRIRSLPCKKYGPYTCPDCNKELTTSQKFASHVKWSHHKDGKKKK